MVFLSCNDKGEKSLDLKTDVSSGSVTRYHGQLWSYLEKG